MYFLSYLNAETWSEKNTLHNAGGLHSCDGATKHLKGTLESPPDGEYPEVGDAGASNEYLISFKIVSIIYSKLVFLALCPSVFRTFTRRAFFIPSKLDMFGKDIILSFNPIDEFKNWKNKSVPSKLVNIS
jgi:hypothetical protein